MSNDLVAKDCFDVALQDLEKTRRLCQELMKLPHYAKMGEVGIFAVSEKAKSIGMHPLEALNGALYFVNGKVEMQGQAMLAMIRKHGHSVTLDPKSTNTHVTMHGKRADNGDTWVVSFSIDDAKKAGIYKNVWEKYPQTMCVWRCVSMLSRFLFSDILKGCYVVGEISDAPGLDAPVSLIEAEVSTPLTYITDQQAGDLYLTLEECDPDFKKRVLEYYKGVGIENLKNLPANSYPQLKGRIDDNHRSYQMTVKAQEIEQEEESE